MRVFNAFVPVAFTLISFVTETASHGIVTGAVVDGVYHQGYNPSFQYQKPPPTVFGWSVPQDSDTGFVSDYSNPDIICHKAATPGGTHASVKAGGTIQVQWTKWPHPGPVLDYLAKCPGDCETADKNSLQFFKIGEDGMLDDGSGFQHRWASDILAANNNSWNVAIPKNIASGNYVLRHEIIALHQAQGVGGAQNYPQCLNLQVTDGGSDNPPGMQGTALYKATDPGIKVNIYTSSMSYRIPGPSIYSGAIQATQAGLSSARIVASSTLPDSTAVSSATSTATYSSNFAASPSSAATASSSQLVTQMSSTAAAQSSPILSSPSIFYTYAGHTAASSSVSALPSHSVPPFPIPPALNSSAAYGRAPNIPLPSDITLQQLLAWVEFSVMRILDAQGSGSGGSSETIRKHSRDLMLERRYPE